MKSYDVIISGASFAGLAVASKIKSGKVLLIDQKKIGKGCKSACGSLFYFIKRLNLEKTVLQLHKKIILHTPQGNLEYLLDQPFCVVDPKKFNQGLFKMGKAQFLKARIKNFNGNIIETDKGNLKGRIFVDASGPETILSPKKRDQQHLSFGIETILPYKEKGFHFWYQPKVFPKGIFWLFPQGTTSRFGIGSYQGKTNLKPYLDKFLSRFKLKAGPLHGGFFPHYLRKPVINKTFFVGDSAGQCIPLTGEGIRPAIIFGQKCGQIIENVLKKKISLKKALKKYEKIVASRKKYYKTMYLMQEFLTSIPESLFYPFAWVASKKKVTSFVFNKYLKIIKDK